MAHLQMVLEHLLQMVLLLELMAHLLLEQVELLLMVTLPSFTLQMNSQVVVAAVLCQVMAALTTLLMIPPMVETLSSQAIMVHSNQVVEAAMAV
jgi:hypothetical protein